MIFFLKKKKKDFLLKQKIEKINYKIFSIL
jgi:hypothetical protein